MFKLTVKKENANIYFCFLLQIVSLILSLNLIISKLFQLILFKIFLTLYNEVDFNAC